MLNEMRERKEGFYHFAKRMSEQHYRYFTQLQLSAEREAFFDQAAAESLLKQQAIEAADTLTLDEYLQAYFAQK